MSSPVDYIGRTYDLLALRGATPIGEVLLTQALFDTQDAGQICTGAQKVAQRWTLRFLTIKGSKKFAKNDGCAFMTHVRRGALRTEADIFAQFSFSAMDVRQQMLAAENATMVDEDRFASATLDSIVLSQTGISLHIVIRTLADTARAVILPIPILPNSLDN